MRLMIKNKAIDSVQVHESCINILFSVKQKKNVNENLRKVSFVA